jgi:hypothetical protein
LIRDIVRRGEASGEFRPGIDPVQLWISIAAMCWKVTVTVPLLKWASHPKVRVCPPPVRERRAPR